MLSFTVNRGWKKMQIKLKKGLPEGVILVREDLYPLVKKIHSLSGTNLRELSAFVDYLSEGSGAFSRAKHPEADRIYEFMAADMARAG